jgi:GAF domain-containing protein
MSTERHRLGALTLCSRRPGAFDAEGIASAEIFARQAAVVLRNSQVYADATQLNANLRFALESRSTIDHAVGIMMAGGGRTADDTFQSLVHASQRENRKIRDLAAEIVDRAEHRTRPTGRSEPRLVQKVDVAGVPVDVA